MDYIIGKNFHKSLPLSGREKILRKVDLFCEELNRTQGIIREISKGFWIRRIKNTNIFKFRLNTGDRCLFTFEQFLDSERITNRLIFLEFVEHDKQVKVANRMSNIEIDFFDYYCDATEDAYDEEVADKYYNEFNFVGYEIKSDSYLKNLIESNDKDYLYYLNAEQYQCLIKKPPVLISGSAGSGKTTIGIRKILNLEETEEKFNKIGYFTFNKFLKDETLKLYKKYKKSENKEIYFYTVKEFCLSELIKGEDSFCSYRRFRKWYQDERKETSRILKNIDVNTIWAEIRGIIKGSMLEDWIRSLDMASNIIDLTFYKELSHKYSDFNSMEREELYNLTVDYNTWLRKNNLYDDNDLALTVINKHREGLFSKFDFIVCDEVQDLTELQIFMLRELTNNKNNIYFSGDIHQIINPTYFSFGRVRNMFYSLDSHKKAHVEILSKNYRSQERIVRLANKLSEIRREKIGSLGSDDYIEYSIRDGKIPVLLDYTDDIVNQILKVSEVNAKFIIIVPDDETVNQLRKINNNAMVRTVADIKGLEYNQVATVNILTNNIRYLEGNNRNSSRHHFNHFYVAITRAIDELYIIEKDQDNFIIKGMDEFVEKRVDFSNPIEGIKSSRSEWYEEAKRLEGIGLFLDASIAYKKAFDYEKEKKCIKKHFFETCDYEKAGDHFYEIDKKEALKCYEKVEYKSLEVQCRILEIQEMYEELGDIFAKIDREKARGYYEKVAMRSKDNIEIKIKLLLLDNKYEEVGELYLNNKMKDSAKAYFRKINKKNRIIDAKILECDNKYEEAGDLLISEEPNLAKSYYKNAEKISTDKSVKERIKNKVLICKSEEIKALKYFIETENERFIRICLNEINTKKLNKSDTVLLNSCFFQAVEKNNLNMIIELLNLSVDINARYSYGIKLVNGAKMTALIWASQKGYLEMVKEFIKAGADLNIKDDLGFTALSCASQRGYLEIVKELLMAGANINVLNLCQQTPIFLAAREGNTEIVKELIEAGADINIQDYEGYTPLSFAEKMKFSEITALIKDANTKLSIPNINESKSVTMSSLNEHRNNTEYSIPSESIFDFNKKFQMHRQSNLFDSKVNGLNIFELQVPKKDRIENSEIMLEAANLKRQGLYDLSHRAYEDIYKRYGASFTLYVSWAKTLACIGMFDEAIHLFDQANKFSKMSTGIEDMNSIMHMDMLRKRDLIPKKEFNIYMKRISGNSNWVDIDF